MSGETIAIIGAGQFGRALSTVAKAAGHKVILWDRGDLILGDHGDAAGSDASIAEARDRALRGAGAGDARMRRTA